VHLLRDRRSALRARLSHDGLDALLVTHPANVFYLTSFRGSAGVVVLTLDGACLITDSRYATVAQGLAAAEAGVAGLTFVQVESSYEETVCDVLKDLGVSRVGIETAHMTLARHDWLERGLAGSGVTLRGTTGLVESFRQVKDADELATMREAGRRISGVMAETLSGLRTGRHERDVAADIDWAIRNGLRLRTHGRRGDRNRRDKVTCGNLIDLLLSKSPSQKVLLVTLNERFLPPLVTFELDDPSPGDSARLGQGAQPIELFANDL